MHVGFSRFKRNILFMCIEAKRVTFTAHLDVNEFDKFCKIRSIRFNNSTC